MDPSEIFKGEIEEIIEKMQKAVHVLHAFKEAFEDHKSKMKTYFSGDMEVRVWEFAPKLVFARYDKFLERAEMIKVCVVNYIIF